MAFYLVLPSFTFVFLLSLKLNTIKGYIFFLDLLPLTTIFVLCAGDSAGENYSGFIDYRQNGGFRNAKTKENHDEVSGRLLR